MSRGRAGKTALDAAVVRTAWAKVNFYLSITGRRPDGYHELDSLVVFAGLGDRLVFAPAEGLELELAGPFAAALSAGADNLVMRAAEALARGAGVKAGARIALTKNLPAAAGLGGGSADAAATLEGLAELWGLAPAAGDLAKLAGGLGADVPVCLYGRPALVRGIGEIIERAPPLPPAWLALVNPGVALSTAEVFAARRGDFGAPKTWGGPAADPAELADRLAQRSNDLETAARRFAPEVDRVLAALNSQSGNLLARMSGSGATCFGLFATQAETRAAVAAIASAQENWWTAAAPLLHGKLDHL